MNSRLLSCFSLALLSSSLFLSTQSVAADNNEGIVVYNAQHENLVKSWVDGFTKETGIKVTLRNGDDSELGNQLVQEGSASPADVFLTENSPSMVLVDNANLFAPLRPGYSEARVAAAKVKSTILACEEFARFKQAALTPFDKWFSDCQFGEFAKGDSPKALIDEVSEALLEHYRASAEATGELLDPYAIYQLLMDYWQSQLQDDLYVLSQDGWPAGRVLRELDRKSVV